tara:strand:- start:3645 stop:4226 length:582 start_codon:yes stop_codon:yes gene_type:complete
MYLLCGLGNPGKRYQFTRHNLGFRIIDKIASENSFEKFKTNQNAEVFKGKIEEFSLYLLKPQQYMNMSGIPIKSFCDYYKIDIEKIIVFHDDIDLKIGRVKFKNDGSSGGHKGIISIDKNFGTNYNRLRLGIGRPEIKNLVDSYVLQKFDKTEEQTLMVLSKAITKNLIFLLRNQTEIFLTNVSLETKENLKT